MALGGAKRMLVKEVSDVPREEGREWFGGTIGLWIPLQRLVGCELWKKTQLGLVPVKWKLCLGGPASWAPPFPVTHTPALLTYN